MDINLFLLIENVIMSVILSFLFYFMIKYMESYPPKSKLWLKGWKSNQKQRIWLIKNKWFFVAFGLLLFITRIIIQLFFIK